MGNIEDIKSTTDLATLFSSQPVKNIALKDYVNITVVNKRTKSGAYKQELRLEIKKDKVSPLLEKFSVMDSPLGIFGFGLSINEHGYRDEETVKCIKGIVVDGRHRLLGATYSAILDILKYIDIKKVSFNPRDLPKQATEQFLASAIEPIEVGVPSVNIDESFDDDYDLETLLIGYLDSMDKNKFLYIPQVVRKCYNIWFRNEERRKTDKSVKKIALKSLSDKNGINKSHLEAYKWIKDQNNTDYEEKLNLILNRGSMYIMNELKDTKVFVKDIVPLANVLKDNIKAKANALQLATSIDNEIITPEEEPIRHEEALVNFDGNGVDTFTKNEVQYIVDGKNRENIKEVNRLKKEVIEKDKRIEQLEIQVANFLKKS